MKAAAGIAVVAAAGVGIVMATRYFRRRAALYVSPVETKEGSPKQESPLKNLPETSPSKKVFEQARERGSNQRRRDTLKQANQRSDAGSLKANNRSAYNRTAHS